MAVIYNKKMEMYSSMLKKDMNIEASYSPTTVI